nr:MAG TPA: TRAF PROTEIN, TRAO PROTEIN, TRAN ADHESION, BACTERIAL SECRETION.5A [Caudoviricetes sp.]
MNYSKPLRKTGIAVAIAAILLTACTNSPKPAPVQPKPLPPALAVPCQSLPPLPQNHSDAVLVALKQMYDLYGICAGLHVDLINYVQKGEEK